MVLHRDNKGTVIQKHLAQYYSDLEVPKPTFYMNGIRYLKTILDRLIWEANYTEQAEIESLQGLLIHQQTQMTFYWLPKN